MRHELTRSSLGKRLDRFPVQAPTPDQMDAARNVLAPAHGQLASNGAYFVMPGRAMVDFYRGGLTAGAKAGRDFLAQIPLTDVAGAAKFSAALKRSVTLAFARMKNGGVNDDALAAWSGGFVTGLLPYAIAWNFGDAGNG